MKLLVTGVNGWIGAALAHHFRGQGHDVRGTTRQGGGPGILASGDIDERTDWQEALRDREVVVHTAARVHVMHERSSDPLRAFRQVNTEGTLRLARQSAAAGVRRLVFLSSVKVNGEYTTPGRPFRHDDEPAPLDPYGRSKQEAEEGLRHIEAETGLQVVVIRPPLVYGPGVKANFAALGRWVGRGLPLPFGRLADNRRSLVSLRNLVSLVSTCIDHPKAAGETFLVSDHHDLSTRELVELLAAALHRSPWLIDVPPWWLQAVGRATGRQAAIDRLTGSLQVDIEHTLTTLGWSPAQTVPQALSEWAGPLT